MFALNPRCWPLLLLALGAGPAFADDVAMAFAGRLFGTLNLTTGHFSAIGNFSITPDGLGVYNGKLYAYDAPNLYQVDVTNGNVTRVGASSTSLTFFGSTLNGLYGYAGGYLYSVNPGTGASTRIGNGLLPSCGGGSSQLSTNDTVLYMNCSGKLYSINPADGTAVVVGPNTGAVVLALSTINGVLFGIKDATTPAMVTLNTTTGAVTTGLPIPEMPNSGRYGLVPLIQPPPPVITNNGIVPIFSTSTTIQSGSWVSIYGTDFTGATSLWAGDFPTSLGNVTVTINNKPAYLWLVSPGQINLQAPDDTATGTVPVVVTNANGKATSTVVLGKYSPSFSMFSSKYPAALVLVSPLPGNSGSGYDLIGPTRAFSFATRPVKAGETLVLYGVGFGPTAPPVTAGKIFSGAAPSVDLPVITIGNVPAKVTFAGMIQAGLFQINVVVPAVGSGDQALQATVGGVTTPPNTVFITVQ